MARQMGVISDFSQITGRVVDHEKPPRYPFTELDFLPKGTRPGLVAVIPPGKRNHRGRDQDPGDCLAAGG